eukprot:CAMPEP_0198648632 /NCGR_PEP_ID=MMETSP1467-20131203/3647_1 /TAXON_ID=1462469 /ORGANISM="unid. sp., Strain CCMP2135" /LENGTH=90 /DNA_ID=CAMNT_0044384365 /DNA_START=48 /DNA_END=320 /DNA_ORIENTATION=+
MRVGNEGARRRDGGERRRTSCEILGEDEDDLAEGSVEVTGCDAQRGVEVCDEAHGARGDFVDDEKAGGAVFVVEDHRLVQARKPSPFLGS